MYGMIFSLYPKGLVSQQKNTPIKNFPLFSHPIREKRRLILVGVIN